MYHNSYMRVTRPPHLTPHKGTKTANFTSKLIFVKTLTKYLPEVVDNSELSRILLLGFRQRQHLRHLFLGRVDTFHHIRVDPMSLLQLSSKLDVISRRSINSCWKNGIVHVNDGRGGERGVGQNKPSGSPTGVFIRKSILPQLVEL